MQTLHLFRSPPSGSLEPCSQLRLQQGLGIEDDRHARSGSPRQILLVSQLALTQFALQPGQLLENIVVEGDLTALRSGDVLQIGTALIRLTLPCEPCYKLEQVRPGLSRQIGQQRGILGMVVGSGTVRLGHSIHCLPDRLPALPDRVKDRFTAFVAHIPVGRVVPTSDLLMALGVTGAYYRGIPAWLKAAPAPLPIHRLVSSQGKLLTNYLPDQAHQLQAEGVRVIAGTADKKYFWNPACFYKNF